MSQYDCAICGRQIDYTRSLVYEYEHGGEVRSSYEPFGEDMRTSPPRIFHPHCYAEQNGVERLVELVEYRNRKNREGFWQMIDEIDSLKQQAAD